MAVELLAVIFSVVLTALAGLLCALAWAAWRRFDERRFLYVGLAFIVIAAAGALALIAELGVASNELFDETFAVEPAPLGLFVAALLLLYLGLLRSRPPSRANRDGRT